MLKVRKSERERGGAEKNRDIRQRLKKDRGRKRKRKREGEKQRKEELRNHE